jgi:hypothetical protein
MPSPQLTNTRIRSGEIPAKSLDFSPADVHASCMRRMIHRLLDRRRERRLALELEHRFRAQLNARAEAAARMADDLQLD